MPKKKPEPKIIPISSPETQEDDDNAVLDIALRMGTQGMTLKRLTTITELLNDQESLIKIAESVAGGASIATVEMKLGLSPGTIKAWLKNGEHDRDGEYHGFYQFYMAAAAEAKHAAESSLLLKNPDKWLDKIDALKQLREGEPEKDDSPIVQADSNPKHTVTYKEFPEKP